MGFGLSNSIGHTSVQPSGDSKTLWSRSPLMPLWHPALPTLPCSLECITKRTLFGPSGLETLPLIILSGKRPDELVDISNQLTSVRGEDVLDSRKVDISAESIEVSLWTRLFILEMEDLRVACSLMLDSPADAQEPLQLVSGAFQA